MAELTIVILGVFIAFQADSFYQGIQDDREEKAYLQRLIEDLEADVSESERLRSTAAERYNYVNLLEDSISSEQPALDDPSKYIKALSEGYYILSIELNRFTFDEMLNTGKLSLVSNPELRRSLLEYYYFSSTIASYRVVREDAAKAFGGILSIDQMFLFGDRSEVEFSADDAIDARNRFIASPEARNSLGRMAEMQLTLQSRARRINSDAQALIEFLGSELNQ